jgi:hypothetical protein
MKIVALLYTHQHAQGPTLTIIFLSGSCIVHVIHHVKAYFIVDLDCKEYLTI